MSRKQTPSNAVEIVSVTSNTLLVMNLQNSNEIIIS